MKNLIIFCALLPVMALAQGVKYGPDGKPLEKRPLPPVTDDQWAVEPPAFSTVAKWPLPAGVRSPFVADVAKVGRLGTASLPPQGNSGDADKPDPATDTVTSEKALKGIAATITGVVRNGDDSYVVMAGDVVRLKGTFVVGERTFLLFAIRPTEIDVCDVTGGKPGKPRTLPLDAFFKE